MVNVTVITPCATQHTGYLERCKASVQALTTPAYHLIGIDHNRRGAGAVRNALLAKVTTPYVVFLDADDTIEPHYLDETLPYIKPKSYVYTGWYEGGKTVIPASPEHIWDLQTFRHVWHVVTCLFNTQDLIEANGFDPHLEGMEDKDLFLRLIRQHCLCPIRVSKPLMRYRHEEGQYSRAHEIRDNGKWASIRQIIIERYGSKMACCGITSTTQQVTGQKLDGDVLANPTWGGNRMYYGRVSGRKYGRVSRASHFYCDPRDVQADNQLVAIEDVVYVPSEPLDNDYGVEIIEGNLSPLQKMAMAYGEDVSAVPVANVPIEPSGKKTVRRRNPKTTLPLASDDASQFTKTT